MASLLFPSCAVTLLLLFISPAIAYVIFDADGEPLLNGKAYYILPDLLGSGGLIVTPGNDSKPCPLYTTPKMYSDGLPITISTPDTIPFLSTYFPIEFYFNSVKSPCNRELRWFVSKTKSEDENAYIIVGVSDQFKDNYVFRIVQSEKGEYVYNIKFCTLLTNKFFTSMSIVEKCVDVGLLPDGLLGITSSPNYNVVFSKVRSARNGAQ